MPERFTPPPGTRFPREGDRAIAFEAGGLLRDKLSLSEVLDYHEPFRGHFTLMCEYEGEIAGVACFKLEAEDVFIDYLTRNDRFVKRGVSVGAVLLNAVLEFARLHARRSIRLDAMQDSPLLEWYSNCGFARDGPAREEAGWGTLCPMRKLVVVRSPP